MSLLKLLGLAKGRGESEATSSQSETLRQIANALDRLEPKRAKFIAAFAYLLGRVAHADLDISDEEIRAMETLVMREGGLLEEQAVLVVQMAKSHAKLFGGTDNFLVAREFGQMATKEQKMALVRCLFAVSAADQSISTVEDNEIRQIASELQLDRRDYTGVKAEFSDYLAVLRKK